MKIRFLAAALLTLAASAGASEIPPRQEAPPVVRIQESGLDAVEARELARKGPGPSSGRPLTHEEKKWAVLGIALLAVILVAAV